MNYSSLIHELNSPLASLQAILFVNQKNIPPEVHEKLANHIDKLTQTSKVVNHLLCPQDDLSTLKNLLINWLDCQQTSIQDVEFKNDIFTQKINGSTTKKEYADLLWELCIGLTKSLNGKLTKTKTSLTLTLPHQLLV